MYLGTIRAGRDFPSPLLGRIKRGEGPLKLGRMTLLFGRVC